MVDAYTPNYECYHPYHPLDNTTFRQGLKELLDETRALSRQDLLLGTFFIGGFVAVAYLLGYEHGKSVKKRE